MYLDTDGYYMIENPSEFEGLKRGNKLKYICINCGSMNTITDFRKNRIHIYSRMLCKECGRKKSCFENNGFISPFELQEYKDKAKQSLIDSIGYDTPFKSPEIMNNIKQHNLETLGVEYHMENDEFRNNMFDEYF